MPRNVALLVFAWLDHIQTKKHTQTPTEAPYKFRRTHHSDDVLEINSSESNNHGSIMCLSVVLDSHGLSKSI